MICIIGAGVAGVMSAYFLNKKGAKVLLIDRADYVASGGSGAAGAFISPKIGKGSKLQKLTNEAFNFASKFYKENFSQHFLQSGILRIPKDSKDARRFLNDYKEFNYRPYEYWDSNRLKEIGLNSEFGGFYFPNAGDVDAKALCQEAIRGIEFKSLDIKSIEFLNGKWHIRSNRDSLEANYLILATGYESNLIDLEYMGIKGLWGSRGDFTLDRDFSISIHKDFSISAKRDGYVKIGATHIKAPNPCLVCSGKPLEPLEIKAKELLDSCNLKLLRVLCGMRSTSRDHSPLLGSVIDTKKMLTLYPNIQKGAKVEPIYHPNLSIINGLGGRGFVFAPLLAKILSEYILEDKPIDETLKPDRLFWKWVRRLNSLKRNS